MTEETSKPSLSPMAEALKGHDADLIGKLAASGATLRKDEAPAKLMAEGGNPNDLDQFHFQSAPRIASTLQAATKAGIDINTPVDGEPASHFLTRNYVTRMVANDYNTSFAAIFGLTDSNHMKYLQAFAENGVDFLQRDAKGRSFTAVGEEAAEDYAKAKAPRTMKADYERLYDDDHPPFSHVKEGVAWGLKEVKRAAQAASFSALATQKVDDLPVQRKDPKREPTLRSD